MRTTRPARAVLAVAALLLGGLALAAPSVAKAPVKTSYTFADEFTGAAGSQPTANWTFQTGGGGWGNDELQQYTDRPANVQLDGAGHLAVTVRRETYTGTDGITRDWTSARLFSRAAISFGYLEARVLLPQGQGIWPAFWTLGSNLGTAGWPACGELDVLEGIDTMSTAFGTAHALDTSTGGPYQYGGSISPAGGLAGSWHTVAISRTSTSVTWYLDGVAYYTLQRSSLTSGQQWPFGSTQNILLNVAVGGAWAGAPDATTPDTATMLVDWVRAGAGTPPAGG